MKLRRAITYAAPFALAATLGASSANALVFDNVYGLQDRTITGNSFNAELAREYQKLVNFEWNKMYDWYDAENHAAKANMAADGKTPMPYVPAEWSIESQSALNELEAARAKLVTALDNGGRTGFPGLAATAQAKYDCWVEQQEEGHQPEDIAACKTDFWAAMTRLDEAKTPKLVKTTISQEVARETVYFDFDESEINVDAATKLDAFVAAMKVIGGIEVAIVGHTDTVGSDAYNQDLSARRATSVVDELVARGMNVRTLEGVELVSKGENDLAVQTGDGVREQRNRRVEIIAIGDVDVEQQVSSLRTQ